MAVNIGSRLTLLINPFAAVLGSGDKQGDKDLTQGTVMSLGAVAKVGVQLYLILCPRDGESVLWNMLSKLITLARNSISTFYASGKVASFIYTSSFSGLF